MSDFENLKKRLKKPEKTSMMDYLERPGAALRQGIYAAQTDQPIMEAVKRGFTEPSEMAPTGQDIADRFAEEYGIENPYVLGTIATAADMADPTSFIPMAGPFIKGPKAIKGMQKAQRALSKVGDVEFPAENIAKAIQVEKALKSSGRVPESAVLNYGQRMPIEANEALVSRGTKSIRIPKSELLQVLEDFPIIRQKRNIPYPDVIVPKSVTEALDLDATELQEVVRQFPILRKKLGF